MLRNATRFIVPFIFLFNSQFAFAINSTQLIEEFSEAQRLTAEGNISEAISLYKAIILKKPQIPEAYNNLAALYLKQKKIKLAKQMLEKGLHAHKGYAALYESLAAINVAMARDAYSKALQIDLKSSELSISPLALQQNTKVNNRLAIKSIKTKLLTEKNKVALLEVKQVMPLPKNSNSDIEKTLQAWSVAWSAQAVDMYLSFYHNQYKSSNGLSKKGWAQSRRYRLKKPSWIDVVLSDFEIQQQSDKQVIVNFKQKYRSNSFNDVSKKQVILLNTVDGWRIFREKSL